MHILDSLITENSQKILRAGAELWKSTILETKIRTYSSCFMWVIAACMRLPLFKMLSNFVHFCSNFQIFCPFLPLFWKIPCLPLLSRISLARWSICPKQYFLEKPIKHFSCTSWPLSLCYFLKKRKKWLECI